MNFSDFPCLYFTSSRLSASDRNRFFGSLAAMFGLGIDKAASSSILFAHISSGVLFDGKGVTSEELLKTAGAYFEKPYADCKSFYRQALIRKIGLKENCCIICPYSASYKNARLDEERLILHGVLEGNTQVFSSNVTADCFHSCLPVSGSSDLSSLPAIPFNAMLFEFLLQRLPNCSDFTTQELIEYVYTELSKVNIIIDMSILDSFISGQLRVIRSFTNYTSESAAVAAIRLFTEYFYKPIKIVAPAGDMPKAERIKKVNSLNEEAFPLLELERALIASNNLSQNSVPNVSEKNNVPMVEEKVNVTSIVAGAITPPDVSKSAKKFKKHKHKLYSSEPARLPDDAITMLRWIKIKFYELHYLLPFCLPVPKLLPALSVDVCSGCHEFDSTWHDFNYICLSHRNLSTLYLAKGCYLGANSPFRIKKGAKIPKHNGCLFANNKCTPCMYQEIPEISASFLPYIINCSTAYLSNLVDFATEACNNNHISVEYVLFEGVAGLLFFLSGKFYFVNPNYKTTGFLKPLLADATQSRLYSVNPIPVLTCFYQLGFKRIRVESVAAFYSSAIGLNELLPGSLIFRLNFTISQPDYILRVMPQYPDVFRTSFNASISVNRMNYERGLRLEWALATSSNLDRIAKGCIRSIFGGNYLNYRFGFDDLGYLTERGTLYIVSLRSVKNLSKQELMALWEDVAGRVGSTSLKFIDYSYLLSLTTSGMTYYCCYDATHFYDILLDCIRSAYRYAFDGLPDVVIKCEHFI